MILDEAQAIKSSSSMRWRVLLSFSCRNRLLLTGTPIQNTMQEVEGGRGRGEGEREREREWGEGKR